MEGNKVPVMTQISYDHGVSTEKLIGETIGNFFDRTVETHRDREALVVRHQNVRWSWGELGRRVDELAAGLPQRPSRSAMPRGATGRRRPRRRRRRPDPSPCHRPVA